MVEPIIVGVDGSPGSLLAARWAAEESVLRRLPLRVVTVLPRWTFEPHDDERVAAVGAYAQKQAREILGEAVCATTRHVPDVEASSDVLPGEPVRALRAASEDAFMVVVGSRGAGGFSGLLLGSVSRGVAMGASCPVVVVREHAEATHGVVVVGVDASPDSVAAVAFALEEAAARGAELRAVRAFSHPVSMGPGNMLPLAYDPELLEREEERLLAESVAGWRERYPQVNVCREAVKGHPVRVLVDASSRADLVVVGSRGRGGFTGLLLGSVSHGVLHHAHCPVAVVRKG